MATTDRSHDSLFTAAATGKSLRHNSLVLEELDLRRLVLRDTSGIQMDLKATLGPKSVFRRAARHFLPWYIRAIKPAWRIMWLNEFVYGHFYGKGYGVVDGDRQPIPWFTYPAIEYLRQLDLSECRVFEWGSGFSTMFFQERCRFLASVEDDPIWFERVRTSLQPSTDYHLKPLANDYVSLIDSYADAFDIIIIDGSSRVECARKALSCVADTGLVILDNSNWHLEASRILREEGDMIEIDFFGPGPINEISWTTSFYLRRTYCLRCREVHQPMVGRGCTTS